MGWKASCLWLVFGVACFHGAYTLTHCPGAGLMILGYAWALVRLTCQPTVRRAFYFCLATAFLAYAPQLWFFTRIFNVAAIVLWLVLAFWVGLFGAITCGCLRCWGWDRAAWLIPVIWTGLEYYRSELYYLKFSWLSVGYVCPAGTAFLGTYGLGLIIFVVATALGCRPANRLFVFAAVALVAGLWLLAGSARPAAKRGGGQALSIVGIQMEFPPRNVIPEILDQALARNAAAPIFVLSEYTLDGPVPQSLKNWCRRHGRFLVVGGEDPAGKGNYYNTIFVVGTNGDVVFQQAKSVPIQFFRDGLPAVAQRVWESPWGKIGFCVCYDLSYRRVTDELVRQGAQLLIAPTMDVEDWSRHEHELHTRVAPVRAAEYHLPIFRLASSGISQAVEAGGEVVAQAPMPGPGAILAANLRLPAHGWLPWDRFVAPLCTAITALVTATLLLFAWQNRSPAGQPA